MVEFDDAAIKRMAERAADEIGLPADLEVRVEVDEGRHRCGPGSSRWTRRADRRERSVRGPEATPSPERGPHVADVSGGCFFRAADRLDPGFGDPTVDDDLPLPHLVAWDCYAVARLARLGYLAQRQRRLYHFRNRHGFTDVADAAFDTIWTATRSPGTTSSACPTSRWRPSRRPDPRAPTLPCRPGLERLRAGP